MTKPTQSEPRALTVIEARDELMQLCKSYAAYWAATGKDPLEMCAGVVFGLFNIFDGTAMGFPAVDLVLRPHSEDQEYHRKNGENWFEPGMVLNDDGDLPDLHEEFVNKKIVPATESEQAQELGRAIKIRSRKK